MTAIGWALAAAVLYGTGAALQQRQAAAAPSQAAGRPRLLLLLVRRPWWLLGIAVELGGFTAHAVALRTGPLTIVQMLLASSLLFSVTTVRLWSGQRLGWTAWAAALSVVAGITSFVALTAPAGSAAHGGDSAHQAGLAAACLAACAAPLAMAGLAAAARRRAVLLAMAAGLADAGLAVVTMAFAHVASHGPAAMATSWATWALLLGGPCSLLLTQTAYQAGRPMITLPVIAVVTPVASLAVGSLLLGETARLGMVSGTLAVLAVLAAAAGLITLARLTAGQPGGAVPAAASASAPAPALTRAPAAGPGPALRLGRMAGRALQASYRPAARGLVHSASARQLAVCIPVIGGLTMWTFPAGDTCAHDEFAESADELSCLVR
ncbi:MAG TPA: DMT family transporter [Streptosporangiaceae bacterium]